MPLWFVQPAGHTEPHRAGTERPTFGYQRGLKRCAEVLNNPMPRPRFVNSPSTVRQTNITLSTAKRSALRIVLLIAPLVALAACASGAPPLANRTALACSTWPEWETFAGPSDLKYRLRLCDYNEDSREQTWDVQFHNDYYYGVSFSFALGEEPVRDRMNLSSGRTSAPHRLRAPASDRSQGGWLHIERFCFWPLGERSC